MTQTFKDFLFLTEERRKDLKYTEKQAKGVLERVTTALSGTESATLTKAAKRYVRLENSLKAMKEKRDELNEHLKNSVEGVFDAEDSILTRVVETAQFTLTLAKEIKKDPTKATDYEAVLKAVMTLVDENLQGQINKLIEAYTQEIPAKTPPKKLTVSEGIVDKLRAWGKALAARFQSWGLSYDKKLNALKSKVSTLTESKGRAADIDDDDDRFWRKRTYKATKNGGGFKKGDTIFVTSAMHHPDYRVLVNDKIEDGQADVDDEPVDFADLKAAGFQEV